MSKEPVKQSAYSDYLYHMIDKWFEQVGHMFTLEDIADFCKIKVTGNMRRRINHCVATGKLRVSPMMETERGRRNVYYRPSESAEGEFPF